MRYNSFSTLTLSSNVMFDVFTFDNTFYNLDRGLTKKPLLNNNLVCIIKICYRVCDRELNIELITTFQQPVNVSYEITGHY